MFHRQFPDTRISANSIRRLYKQNGIKFKFIARAKREVNFEVPYFRDWFYRMRSQLKDVEAKGLKLVFLDEAVFTFNTMATRAWFSAYDCLKLRDAETRIKTMALVAAISEDKGLEGYMLHPRSISSPQYIDFLETLSAMYDSKPFAIFLDNLSVHKTNEVLEVYKRLKITTVFNVPYSPQFNGIESYFSLIKGVYKKLLMKEMLKGNRVTTEPLIKRSIQQVEDDKVMNCVRNGLGAVQC